MFFILYFFKLSLKSIISLLFGELSIISLLFWISIPNIGYSIVLKMSLLMQKIWGSIPRPVESGAL